MSKFTWEDEERLFKRRVHGEIIASMHNALACDIRPNGRGDKAAHFASEHLWLSERRNIERHRSEVLELRGEIRKLRAQVTKLQSTKAATKQVKQTKAAVKRRSAT
jgi:hypothetical protein